MKLDKLLRGILSLLVVMILMCAYINSDAQNTDDSNGLSDVVYLADSQFDNHNNENLEIIEYTNNFNYPVTISENNLSITCEGVGNTRESDEFITSNYFRINTYFSKEKDGERYESLTVKKKEKIYIFIVSSYDGEQYPTNEVTCKYNISLLSV